MKTVALFFALIIPMTSLADTSDDLIRNKALVDVLAHNTYARDRVVKHVSRGSETSPLLISLPRHGLKSFPVLYVLLDGNPTFLSGLEFSHNAFHDNVIFVGMPSSNRVRDYSSRYSAADLKDASKDAQRVFKMSDPKADDFTKHLALDIVPFLEKEYGPFAIKILVGFSLGGIATLDVLMSYPDAFDAYGALDPSLWYNYDYYENKMVALAKKSGALSNKCLLMSASEDEGELAMAARRFDRLLVGLDLPSSFKYSYRRLTELQHGPAIKTSFTFVAPFIFNIADIIPEDELKGLSLEAFENKLKDVLQRKTCIRQENDEVTAKLYDKFGESLVKEKRFSDAFNLYEKMRTRAPEHTLEMLAPDGFAWSAFEKLSTAQKDRLAGDYEMAYEKALSQYPEFLIRFTNLDLHRYAKSGK